MSSPVALKRYAGSSAVSEEAGTLVLIGNFDGVHRGHQVVLADGAARAAAAGLRATVLTFDPHPAVVLGRSPPPTLTTLARKIELIQRSAPGTDVAVARFDAVFAAQSPAEFAERVLRDALGARAVAVGKSFRFGRARAGDFAELARLGKKLGFDAHAHELVGDAQGAWSSTRVRGAIANGDLDGAAELLGRPHMVSGVVVSGDRRGRALGFPTTNLASVEEMLPPFGVYAVLVDREDESGRARTLALGAANYGVRPTLADPTPAPLLEVHLLDVDADLYGARLRVHFVARLRGEEKFASLEALKAQMTSDIAETRRLLADRRPDPAANGAWT